MGTENQEQENQQEQSKPETIGRDEVQALVNSALASHTKRIEARFDKSLGELKTLLQQQAHKPEPTETKPEPTEPTDDKKPSDARYKMLEQQLADLKRQAEEERASRLRIEEDRRRDTTRSQLRKHLEDANVRPELLDMVLSHWEATGTLRYDEGKPLVSVKRSRSKNGPEEEITFDDLKAGVEDFVKSPTAAVLLKPPASAQQAAAVNRPTGPIRTYERPAQSEEEAAARLVEVLGNSLFVNE